MIQERLFEKILNNNLETINNFKIKLNNLKKIDYTSSASLMIIETLFSMINELEKQHTGFRKQLYLNKEGNYAELTEAFIEQMRSISIFLSTIYELVFTVQSSAIIQNPVSISFPMNRLANEILKGDPIMTFSSEKCNFFCLNFKEIINKLTYFDFKVTIKPIILLGFPDLHKTKSLSYSLLGHELGHRIIEKYNILGKTESIKKELIKKELKKSILKKDQVILNMLAINIKEYVCDIIGIYLFGIAYFFSLIEFAYSILDYYTRGGSHPPLCLRLRNMIDSLDSFGQLDDLEKHKECEYFEKICSIIEEWRNSLDDIFENKIYGTEDLNHYNVIKNILIEARNSVEKKIEKKYKCILTNEVSSYINDYIAKGIPPSINTKSDLRKDMIKPSQLFEVLNAGWFYRIYKYENYDKNCDKNFSIKKHIQGVNDLSRLIEKTVMHIETINWINRKKVNL